MMPEPELLDFQDIASFLNQKYVNWNNNKNPCSYMIPPIFKFKYAEKSDDDVRLFESDPTPKSGSYIPYGKHRYSDQAECTVYNALSKLTQDGICAPFIAVQGLDMHKIRNRLSAIFQNPDLDELENYKKLGEYDFVVIGPKIGVVAIEVKYSHFTQAGHFAPGMKFFPEYFFDGIKQLRSLDVLIDFLRFYTNISEDIDVTRILFTPNLSKERYEKWLSTLENSQKEIALGKLVGIQLWFSEDQSCGQIGKVPLYHKLEQTFLTVNRTISNEIYNAYVPILAGVRSISLSKGRGLEFDKSILAEKDSIFNECSRIQLQDATLSTMKSADSVENWPLMDVSLYDDLGSPSSKRYRSDQHRSMGSDRISIDRWIWKVSLTEEQQAAYDGPEVQMLLGPAGSGKSIVLKRKISNILDRSKRSVVVLAPKNCMKSYKRLGDGRKKGHYKVRSWVDERRSFVDQIKPHIDQKIIGKEKKIYRFIEKSIKELAEGRGEEWLQKLFRYFSDYDCIFIDDALDVEEMDMDDWHIGNVAIFAWMTYAKLTDGKTVWAAIDTWSGATRFQNGKKYKSSLISKYLKCVSIDLGSDQNDQIVKKGISLKEFPTTMLKKVMRCPENVFQSAYSPQHGWIDGLEPILGHKIQGSVAFQIDQQCGSLKTAMEFVWENVKNYLTNFQRQEIDMDCVSIITRDSDHLGYGLSSFLLDRCVYIFCPGDLPHGDSRHSGRKREGIRACPGYPWIGYWTQVSSMEWPIVIYASCVENGAIDWEYSKYRACSRATGKLIEITAYYDKSTIV